MARIKISEKTILEMQKDRKAGMTYKTIGEKYDVRYATVIYYCMEGRRQKLNRNSLRYYKKNKEDINKKMKIYSKEYYRKNRERLLEYGREYHKNVRSKK